MSTLAATQLRQSSIRLGTLLQYSASNVYGRLTVIIGTLTLAEQLRRSIKLNNYAVIQLKTKPSNISKRIHLVGERFLIKNSSKYNQLFLLC